MHAVQRIDDEGSNQSKTQAFAQTVVCTNKWEA